VACAPTLGWGTVAGEAAQIKGFLWDALLLEIAYPIDSVKASHGEYWYCVGTGTANNQPWSLWFRTGPVEN